MVVIATADGVRTLEAPGSSELAGRSVSALAPSERGLWALVDGAVWSRGNGAWAEAGRVDGPPLRCLLPRGDGVLAGTAEAHLVRLAGGDAETLAGFEAAPGRGEWFTPWGGPPDVRSMAAGSEGELYANVHVGGILRSDDDGASWRPTIDIRSDVHQVLAPPGRPGLVLAATAVGLATSEDGGESWSFAREGLAASYCRAVALCGESVLLTASEGPGGRAAAVYRRPLGADGAFERCTDWFDRNIDTGRLAADGELAAFGTEDGRVFTSADVGATWTLAASGLPRVQAVSTGFHPG
jgi:hypothetical protein